VQSRDFCYWLQGFFELHPDIKRLNSEQIDLIKKHLHLVFTHEIDPSFKSPDPKKSDEQHMEELRKIHEQLQKQDAELRQVQMDHRDSSRKIMC
jgi:hypothetical protein